MSMYLVQHSMLETAVIAYVKAKYGCIYRLGDSHPLDDHRECFVFVNVHKQETLTITFGPFYSMEEVRI